LYFHSVNFGFNQFAYRDKVVGVFVRFRAPFSGDYFASEWIEIDCHVSPVDVVDQQLSS
jgi:hypothetical protein